MTILSEILDWATAQEDWKQDIVRRILSFGEYTDKDVKEIAEIVLAQNGYRKSSSIKAIPINRSDFTSIERASSSKVVLRKLESPTNVNALTSDSKLQFALDGLTIVYGENGVGKSGYSRLLKSCCKARSVDSVLPNVFDDQSSTQASVKLEFSENENVIQYEWSNTAEGNEFLQQIVVYDNKCGKIQVTDKNELIYLPSGTDIFKKIIDCISEVKNILSNEKPKEVKINLDKIDLSSSIYKYVSKITKDTESDELLKKLEWSEKNESDLVSLSKKIVDANETEIKKKVTALDKEITSLTSLQSDFDLLEKSYSEEKQKNLSVIINNKLDSKKALDELSQSMSTDGMISGTGNELWRVLYDAAKDFSEKVAYPDSTFPNETAKCVFCQQDLVPDAKMRLETFKRFAEGKIKKNFDDIVVKIDKAKVFLEGHDSKIIEAKKILDQNFTCLSEDNVKILKEKLDSLNSYRLAFIDAIKKEDVKLLICDTSNDSKISIFEQVIVKTKATKEEIKKSINPEELKKTKNEKSELDSLKIASSKKSDFVDYINYLKSLDQYNTMIKALDHTSISRKGSSIITNSLKDTFLKALTLELSKLGGEKIPLFIDSSTKDGKPTFQLSLKGANMPPRSKIDLILSEGEQKIASLAGLLAELDTAKHQNGLILDDPVTSLDHQYRKNIAKRLVQEAKERQVVIFTHDIAFLFDLEFFAKELNVPTHLQNIRKDGKKSGIIFNTNPWHAQNVKARIKTLSDDVDTLKSKNLNGDDYNHEAGIIYGRIRETWERTVEEVLFNEVVTRFGQGIQTQRLNGVTVDDADFSKISFEMSKCSKYMIGHDKSLSLSDDRPKVDEIKTDISAISQFVKDINKKKDDLIKKRKEIVDKTPVATVVD
mgnify:CR=1 FL=1